MDRKYTVFYSQEDEAWVGTCSRFPSLSCVEDSPTKAIEEIIMLEGWVITSMEEED